VFLEWTELANGRCFGFNKAKNCFISFTLKKALQKSLVNNPGVIQENLKFLNLTNPLLFNGINNPAKGKKRLPVAVTFQGGVLIDH